MSMEIQRYLYIFIAIKIQHCSCSEKWWRNLLILKLLEELFVYFIWTSTPEIPFHIYIVQSCCKWQFLSISWSSDPPPPTFFRSFINERKMKRFWNEPKKKRKKEMSLKLKNMFFLLPLLINVHLLHKRKIMIKQLKSWKISSIFCWNW